MSAAHHVDPLEQLQVGVGEGQRDPHLGVGDVLDRPPQPSRVVAQHGERAGGEQRRAFLGLEGPLRRRRLEDVRVPLDVEVATDPTRQHLVRHPEGMAVRTTEEPELTGG